MSGITYCDELFIVVHTQIRSRVNYYFSLKVKIVLVLLRVTIYLVTRVLVPCILAFKSDEEVGPFKSDQGN